MEPKALPPAKINTTKLLGGRGGSLTTTIKKISVKSISDEKNSLGIGVIKKQVIHINNLVKINTLLKVKEEERKRKLLERKRFGEKEEKLEEPKGKENKIPSLPALPKLGFLERIKNFLFNVFLGYISLRLLPYLPKLAGVVGTIVKVQDIIIDWSGKILNGLVSFVDKAYEVHDKTRKFLGNLGGETFIKTFDGFIGAMDKVIEASIIAAIAFGELRDTGGGPGAGDFTNIRGGAPGRSRYGADPAAARRYAQRFGRQAAIERFGEEGVRSLGGKYARSGITNLARRGLVGVLKRGGTKTALRVVRPLVRNIPLIGGIMEFVLSWMSGDPVGKAAFRGVGGGLGTWVGGALGTLIGGPIGAGIGMWLGSEGGAALGGLLYDKIFNNKDPKGQPIQGRAQGGPITRGGRLPGSARRTLQKPKPKRTLKVQVTEVKPGQSVGGKENIKKVFPETPTKESGKTVNPLGYMKKSYKTASSILGFGGLATIFMKGQLGEKPLSTDYQNAADGLSAWMQTVYGSTTLRKGAAFAEGGRVDASMFSDDIGMKTALSKALQDTISPKVDEMINDLRKQVGLKSITATRVLQNVPQEGLQPEGEYDLGEGAGGSPELRREVAKAAAELGVPAPDLLGCILAESGGIPSRTNQFGCTGLIQFCPDSSGGSYKTIGGERIALSSLRSMSIAQQMKYVVKYLKAAGVKPGMNGYDIYSAIHAGGPGKNVVDANGVSTRGFYASNVEPLIRRARENSRLIAGGDLENYVEGSSVNLNSLGLMNPAPRSSPGLSGSYGYATDSGLDIMGKTGDPVIAPASGTLLYAEQGHTSWKDDSNPGLRGHQPQHSFLIQLAKPFKYAGKTIKYAYGTHLTSLGKSFANKSGVPIRAGQYIGRMGVANNAAHLHLGLLQNRAQSSEEDWLSNTQVKQVLLGSSKFIRGGKVNGKRGIDQIRAMLTHGEFVLDVDSTKALEENFPGFLNALNKANYDGAIKVLRNYAEYEQGATIHAMINEKMIPVPIPVSSPQQSFVVISAFGEPDDYMSSSYRG